MSRLYATMCVTARCFKCTLWMKYRTSFGEADACEVCKAFEGLEVIRYLVLLFSKLNVLLFGCFDPKIIFFRYRSVDNTWA